MRTSPALLLFSVCAGATFAFVGMATAAAAPITYTEPGKGSGQWIVVDSTDQPAPPSTVYGHMWPRPEPEQPLTGIGHNGGSAQSHLHFDIWDRKR